MMVLRKIAMVLCLLLPPCVQGAGLRMPSIFSDNMVLQTGQPLPVWGWAEPDQRVEVKILGQTAATQAEVSGAWRVTLAPIECDHAFTMTIATPEETKIIRNILAGEVWVCSGQSNMQMPLEPYIWSDGVYDYESVIEQANAPTMRLFMVPIAEPEQPQQDVEGSWKICTPQSAAAFSATAYFFGRELNQDLGRPVGLIQTAAGGTLVQQWMSPQSIEGVAGYKQMTERFNRGKAQFIQDYGRYEQERARWLAEGGAQTGRPEPTEPVQDLSSLYPDRAAAQKELRQQYLADKEAWEKNGGEQQGQPAPAVPVQETILPAPSRLYGGMVHPLIPFAIKGVIWYQGEGNTGDPYNWGHPSQYRELFEALITDWRQAWGQGDFPFYFCQLPGFAARPRPTEIADPANPEDKTTFPAGDAWPEHSWPQLREAQSQTLELANTGMAVLIDAGDAYNIHPRNKLTAGERLARLALTRDYGQKVASMGPCYRSMQIEEGRAILHFDDAEGGLRAREGSLKGFSIAGPDQQFYPAQAAIKDNGVAVWSPQVPQPAAVRYAWTANPWATLFNRAGLPAAPFRTDDWPLAQVHQVEP